MIETLNGTQETVNFKNRSILMPYDNHEYEIYPIHWHMPIEIILPIQNGYPVVCNGVTYNLRERDILLIQPGVLHHMPAVHGRRYILQASLPPMYNSTVSPFHFPFLPSAVMLTPEQDERLYLQVRNLIYSIYHEQSRRSQTSELTMYISLLQVLLLVSNAVLQNKISNDVRQSKNKTHIEVFLKICDYLNNNYAENITLDEIAKRSGFSKFYFNRQFKAMTGETFYKYLSRTRIRNADMQLASQSTSITDIACNTGFSTPSAFIRMFKNYHHCTPSEFRSMYVHYDTKEF